MNKIILALLLSGVYVLHAQNNNASLQQIMKQGSIDINTLAAYPENVRQNMFEVAMHPEGVAKLNDVQKKSYTDFKSLIASYSKNDTKLK